MNNKILSLVFGVAILGALASLHLYKSSSSSSTSSLSIKDLDPREFLLDVQELSYRLSLFKEWTDTNKKHYSVIEAPLRFKVWNKNYDIVQEHNAKNLSWTLGMNLFADLSREEFSALHLGFRVDQAAIKQHEESIEILDESLMDTSVDWRSKGAVTAVKDQAQCGTCYSFSSAGALEGLRKIKKGTLESLSAAQINDCSGSYGNQGCNGGTMVASFQYTEANGIESDSSYPYKGSQGSCKHSTSRNALKNTGYKSVSYGVSQLQAAVTKQPVSVGVEADQSAFQLYTSGVVSSGCGTNLDHAILAVGFTSSYWIVKNQWGTSWGQGGYIHIAKNSRNVCGILSMPSYPTL